MWRIIIEDLTKQQSLEWKRALLPTLKKARLLSPEPRRWKSFFLMFMKLTMQNSCCKVKLLTRMSTKTSFAVWCVLWERKEENCGKWLLYHDNAQAHNALGIWEFLVKNYIAVLEQPPYSPNLAPCDFLLIFKLKKVIKETLFFQTQKHAERARSRRPW